MQQQLSLKDLSVGQKFASSSYEMTAEEIKKFAAQFDPQPFHMDEAQASQSIFKGLTASGWHTMSVCMRLIVESVTLECGLIGLGGTLSWLKPVRPGNRIRVESSITAITPSQSKPGQAVIELHSFVKNEKDENVVDFTSKLMAFDKA
jgi:acyl dehydratase